MKTAGIAALLVIAALCCPAAHAQTSFPVNRNLAVSSGANIMPESLAYVGSPYGFVYGSFTPNTGNDRNPNGLTYFSSSSATQLSQFFPSVKYQGGAGLLRENFQGSSGTTVRLLACQSGTGFPNAQGQYIPARKSDGNTGVWAFYISGPQSYGGQFSNVNPNSNVPDARATFCPITALDAKPNGVDYTYPHPLLNGLAADNSGNVWVTDTTYGKMWTMKFNTDGSCGSWQLVNLARTYLGADGLTLQKSFRGSSMLWFNEYMSGKLFAYDTSSNTVSNITVIDARTGKLVPFGQKPTDSAPALIFTDGLVMAADGKTVYQVVDGKYVYKMKASYQGFRANGGSQVMYVSNIAKLSSECNTATSVVVDVDTGLVWVSCVGGFNPAGKASTTTVTFTQPDAILPTGSVDGLPSSAGAINDATLSQEFAGYIYGTNNGGVLDLAFSFSGSTQPATFANPTGMQAVMAVVNIVNMNQVYAATKGPAVWVLEGNTGNAMQYIDLTTALGSGAVPASIDYDSAGNVYVAATNGNIARVSQGAATKFGQIGSTVTAISVSRVYGAEFIVAASASTLYVSGIGNSASFRELQIFGAIQNVARTKFGAVQGRNVTTLYALSSSGKMVYKLSSIDNFSHATVVNSQAIPAGCYGGTQNGPIGFNVERTNNFLEANVVLQTEAALVLCARGGSDGIYPYYALNFMALDGNIQMPAVPVDDQTITNLQRKTSDNGKEASAAKALGGVALSFSMLAILIGSVVAFQMNRQPAGGKRTLNSQL